MARSSVVLPEPEPPIMATTWPGCTSILTSSRTMNSPYPSETPVKLTIGSEAAWVIVCIANYQQGIVPAAHRLVEPRVYLPGQAGCAHQEFIDGARTLASFADCPDDQ